MERLYKDPEWLQQAYQNGCSRSIAEEVGVSSSTIRNWRRRFNVLPSDERIKERIEVQCKNCGAIIWATPSELEKGRQFCSPKCFHIWRTGKPQPNSRWDKEELRRLYWDEQLDCAEIAEMKDAKRGAVSVAMSRLGIKKRTRSEIAKLMWAKGKLKPCQRRGLHSRHWNGGRRKTSQGYILIYCPEHPRLRGRTKVGGNKYVFEHILVWEKTHGKPVPKEYQIHHLNGIRDDNRPENLVAVPPFKHPQKTLVKSLQKRIKKLEDELEQHKQREVT